MKKTNHKLFAGFLLGSIGAWYIFGTSPHPMLAVPIAIVWIFITLRNKVQT
jgi:hypothetical protein